MRIIRRISFILLIFFSLLELNSYIAAIFGLIVVVGIIITYRYKKEIKKEDKKE